MTIDQLGSLGEIIAAVATLATLAYLAAQIRQSTRATRTANFLTVNEPDRGRESIDRRESGAIGALSARL